MCVCVCVLFVDVFRDDLSCLFSPHQVNHGGVQKPPAQVSLYKSHTTEEPLRRHRSVRYLVVTSALTSADVSRTSGSRSPDETDGAAGSVTHSTFVRFTSNFVHLGKGNTT